MLGDGRWVGTFPCQALPDCERPPNHHLCSTPLQVSPPGWFAANVVHHPVRLQQLAAAFLRAFAFDASIAGMLLYAGAPPAGAATNYTAAAAASGAAAAAVAAPAGAAGGPGGEAAQQAQPSQQHLAAQGSSSPSVVLLPRMPLGLALITTAATYEAVASALRAAAALAAAADAVPGSSGTALRRLIDAFLTQLQQVVEAGAGSSGGSKGDGRTQHRRQRRQQPEQEQGAAEGGMAGDLEVGGQQPWHGRFAGGLFQGCSRQGVPRASPAQPEFLFLQCSPFERIVEANA